MGTYAETVSQTYTIADVGRVVDCFAADLDMVAQATGLWARDYARRVADDVKLIAENGYLKEVNICLLDEDEKPLRASKYEVAADGSLQTTQRPGNNMWPRIPDTQLSVVLIRTTTLPVSIVAKLKTNWGGTNMDTAFSHLARRADRDYVSNGFGMRKSVYT